MATVLPKGSNILEEPTDIQTNENRLYFPSFTYNYVYNKLFYRKNNGYQEQDILNIPSLNNIKVRLKHNEENADDLCLGSNKFIEKFLTSKNILIIDTHIDKSFFRYVENILSSNLYMNVQRIEIISSQKDTFQYFNSILNIMRSKNISFKIYTDLKKDTVHDRFVLFDNELWHFGGTVGGIQKGLTAFSTGWVGYDFEKLFYNLKEEYNLKGYPNE